MTDTHRDTQPVTAIHRKQYLACVLLALLALSPMLVLPWLNTSVAVNGADELDAWPQQAAALGLPLVDAQCNGRANPTGVMGSMNLHRDPGYITTMTCAGGNPETGRYVEGVFRGTINRTAALVRAASVEAGGVVGVARNPVTAAYVRKNGAVGGISSMNTSSSHRSQ